MSEQASLSMAFDNGSTNNDNDNNVSVKDSAGAFFLGIITLVLLLALLRNQRYTRQLLEKQIEDLKRSKKGN